MQRGVQGVPHELRRRRIDVHTLQRDVITHAFLLQRYKAFHCDSAGTHFAHRIQIQFKMAVMTLGRTIIGLFTQHDFVDQARGLGVSWRQPRQLDARQFLLQALGQRHEIPHGKYMGFHEALQYRQRMYFRENGMCTEFCFFLDKAVFIGFHE
ncbi:hypothetical protein D3C85_1421480 [compost metagenome]